MQSKETTRQQKISRLIQRDLGELLREEGRSTYSGTMISVTKVYVTRDLSLARIYVSLFGGKTEAVFEHLSKRDHEFRGKLGNMMRHQLRIIPNLEFYIDDSLDYLENIEQLLKE